MQLTRQHIVKTEEWKPWCVKAKNLYNQALYYWRQSMFKNIEYFTENELRALFIEFDEENFRELPSHCSQEIIRNLFKNIKSWQKARYSYIKNPTSFTGPPRIPKYKKELSFLSFTKDQVKLKNGFIHFPKMINVPPIKTNIPNIQSCRVIPRSSHFVVEFVYNVQEPTVQIYNGKALGVDLGVNNLAACLTTTGQSFIINGKPLKADNQLYNKRKAVKKSLLPLLPKKFLSKTGNRLQVGTSKAIQKITIKRNNQIKNYVHHASRLIVNKAKDLDITKIVIGHNKGWKDSINIGKKSNQTFACIPHSTLINLIKYKAILAGIEVVTTEESYTSKCSFVDTESLKRHTNYVGKRINRGLFLTKNKIKINADVAASGNILRKVIGDFEINDSIVGSVVAPKKLLYC